MIGPEPAVAADKRLRSAASLHDLQWLPPATGPAESALAALDEMTDRPVLITSADHALLTPEIIDTFCNLALAQRRRLCRWPGALPSGQSRFPRQQAHSAEVRRRYFLRQQSVHGENPAGAGAVRFWQTMQSHRKRPWRMATELGISTLISYLLGRLRLGDALSRIGGLAGCRIGHVELLEARAAVDVDSLEDHALAERVIESC